ncbi:protein of unknown function [Amycolatopsis xylanica]|uniref:DUF4360 domain-containing protein n=1 Tax=Amycolatopsis xylanica TaxID=589385 RepID=A0A1H3PI01_9PSEU|nr:DUF4360 domain-containing protein [Amycolatopsis xylanica]SDZ00628.1 protein of unknown function [Amycolatopsis xylanica]
MLTTAAATLLAVSSAVVPATGTDEVPASVEVASVNGSGCPAGTADTSASGNTFSVSYRAFFAQAGGGANPADSRRNCQLSLRVSLPPGYTYGLAATSYTGFAHVEEGASALHRVSFYFQGTSPTVAVDHPFTGPLTGEWRSDYRPAEIVYSPCGDDRNLNINAELRVRTTDPSKRSFLVADASRGALRAKYEFAVKPC